MNTTKNSGRCAIAIVLIALTAGCENGSISSSDEQALPVVTQKVAAFKQECAFWFGYGLCLQGRADDSQEWRPTSMPGLDFKWGHEYSVQFRDTPVEEPLPDGPAFARELLMVTDLGPVQSDTEFVIAMRARDPLGPDDGFYITNIGTDSYQAYSGTSFVCATPEVCLQVENIIEQNMKFLGRFGLRPELGLPLVLNEVVCEEENDDRRVLCDETLHLAVTSEVLDQFMQPADTFITTEQVFAKFSLNNSGATDIDFGSSLCHQIRISFQFPDRDDFPPQGPIECEIQGASEVSLGANSEATLVVDLNALIIDTFGGNPPFDYLVSLKFYNQPTSVFSVSIQ